jgi:hypothetical protein
MVDDEDKTNLEKNDEMPNNWKTKNPKNNFHQKYFSFSGINSLMM